MVIILCALVTLQDGDVAKINVLLSKRAEVLFSIDAKDPQTGSTAIMSASQRGHHKVGCQRPVIRIGMYLPPPRTPCICSVRLSVYFSVILLKRLRTNFYRAMLCHRKMSVRRTKWLNASSNIKLFSPLDSYTVSQKTVHFCLSELRQISMNFNKFWQLDGKIAEIVCYNTFST